jgi:hypothetical protein
LTWLLIALGVIYALGIAGFIYAYWWLHTWSDRG